jgi:hypothetical protein
MHITLEISGRHHALMSLENAGLPRVELVCLDPLVRPPLRHIQGFDPGPFASHLLVEFFHIIKPIGHFLFDCRLQAVEVL